MANPVLPKSSCVVIDLILIGNVYKGHRDDESGCRGTSLVRFYLPSPLILSVAVRLGKGGGYFQWCEWLHTVLKC